LISLKLSKYMYECYWFHEIYEGCTKITQTYLLYFINRESNT